MADRKMGIKFGVEGVSQSVADMSKIGKSLDDLLAKSQQNAQKFTKLRDQALSGGDQTAADEFERQRVAAAQRANDVIASSYKTLGVTSTASQEAYAKQQISAYKAIRDSGVASYEDILKAQEALNKKLQSSQAGAKFYAGSTTPNFVQNYSAKQGGDECDPCESADKIVKAIEKLPSQIARASGRGLLQRAAGGIVDIATSPFKMAANTFTNGLAGIATGLLNKVGFSLADEFLTKGVSQNSQKIKAGIRAINEHLIGTAQVYETFLAELSISGNLTKAAKAGIGRTTLSKDLDQLMKLQELISIPAKERKQKIEFFKKNPEIANRYEEIKKEVEAKSQPQRDRVIQSEFVAKLKTSDRADKLPEFLKVFDDSDRRSEFLKQNPEVGKIYDGAKAAVDSRYNSLNRVESEQQLVKSLQSNSFAEGVINPLINEFKPLLTFIQGMQNYRTTQKADEIYQQRKSTFPKLNDGENVVSVIGGAQFAEGQGGRKVAVGLEGLDPKTRFIPVQNPDTDKTANPSQLDSLLSKALKRLLGDNVKDAGMANTIENAVKQVSFALDPTRFSTAAAESLANTRLTQEQGKKASVVSFSLGGADAVRYDQALQYSGLKGNTLAMAYPYSGFTQNASKGFKAEMVSGDPLTFGKGLGVGVNTGQLNVRDSTVFGAEAHAYKHLFKQSEFLVSFLDSIGSEMPDFSKAKDPSKLIDGMSRLYEQLGAAEQLLSVLNTGELNLKSPFKGFGGDDSNISGMISTLPEYTKTIQGMELGGSDQTIEIAEKLKRYFSQIESQVTKLFQSFNVELPQDLEKNLQGFFKYQSEISSINQTIQAFRSGKLPENPDTNAFFAGDLDPSVAKQRSSVLKNDTIRWFKGGDGQKFGDYQAKIVEAYNYLSDVVNKFVETQGNLPEDFKQKLTSFEGVSYPEPLQEILGKSLNTYNLPSEEESRTSSNNSTLLNDLVGKIPDSPAQTARKNKRAIQNQIDTDYDIATNQGAENGDRLKAVKRLREATGKLSAILRDINSDPNLGNDSDLQRIKSEIVGLKARVFKDISEGIETIKLRPQDYIINPREAVLAKGQQDISTVRNNLQQGAKSVLFGAGQNIRSLGDNGLNALQGGGQMVLGGINNQLVPSIKSTYNALKIIESGLLNAVPPLKLLKSGLQDVAFPLAAIAAARQFPILSAAIDGATGLIQSGAANLAGGLGGDVASAIAGQVGKVLPNFIGTPIKAMIVNSLPDIASGLGGALAGTGATVLAGQTLIGTSSALIKGAGNTLAKSVGIDLESPAKPALPPTQRQSYSQDEDLLTIEGAVEQRKTLQLPPVKSNRAIAIEKDQAFFAQYQTLLAKIEAKNIEDINEVRQLYTIFLDNRERLIDDLDQLLKSETSGQERKRIGGIKGGRGGQFNYLKKLADQKGIKPIDANNPLVDAKAIAPQQTDLLRMNPNDINVDPKRFQYKILGQNTKSGSVGSIKDAEVYKDEFSGLLQVWKDPEDGKTYVVNGHNRLAKAREKGAESVKVEYIKAETAKEARSVGALANIADDKGTPLDAAKFLRDSDLKISDLKKLGVSLTDKVASQGVAIAQLSEGLFNKTMTGEIPVERAALIGGSGLSPEKQESLATLINKGKGKPMTNEVLSELIDTVKSSGTTSETQIDLFGSSTVEKDLAIEKAQLQAVIKKRLASEKKLFGTVGKSTSAEKLAEGGNVINVNKSQEISQQAAIALQSFDQLKNVKGLVSDELNKAAERIAGGENTTKVTNEVYGKIREAVRQELASFIGRGKGTSSQGNSPTANIDGDSSGAATEVGQNIVSGLDKGIDSNAVRAIAKDQLAEPFIEETQSLFEIQSPSKWGIRVGKFIKQGLGIGLDGIEKVAETAAFTFQKGFELANLTKTGFLNGVNYVNGLIAALKAQGSQLAENLVSTGKLIGDRLKFGIVTGIDFGAEFLNKVGSGINAVSDLAISLGERVGNKFKQGLDKVISFKDTATGIARSRIDATKNKANLVGTQIKTGIDRGVDSANQVITPIIGFARDTLEKAKQGLNTAFNTTVDSSKQIGLSIGNSIKDGIDASIQNVQAIATKFSAKLQSGFNIAVATGQFIGSNVSNSIKSRFESGLGVVSVVTNTVVTGLKVQLDRAIASAESAGNSIKTGILSGIQSVKQGSRDFIKGIGEGFGDDLNQYVGKYTATAFNTVVSTSGKIGNSVKNSINAGIQNIGQLGTQAFNKFTDGFNSGLQTAQAIGASIKLNIQSGIDGTKAIGIEALDNIKLGFNSALNLGVSTGQSIKTGIQSGLQGAKTVVQQVSTAIGQQLGAVGQFGQSIGVKIQAGVSVGINNLKSLAQQSMQSVSVFGQSAKTAVQGFFSRFQTPPVPSPAPSPTNQGQSEAFNVGLGIGQATKKGVKAGLDTIEPIARAAATEIKKAVEPTKDFLGGFLDGMRIKLKGFGGSIKSFGLNLLAAFGIYSAGDVLIRFARDIFDTTVKFERLTNVIKNSSGSSAQFTKNIGFLNSEINRLNIDKTTAFEQFGQLQGALRGTALEGDAGNKIFSAISQAGQVQGLDPQKQQQAFLATTQIISKGQVQAEELRGQLSEALPQAYTTFAKALGKTTAQLNIELKEGKLGNDELLKFAAQLKSDSDSGVAGAADLAQNKINRLNNSLTTLQEKAGQSTLPLQKLGLDVAAGAVEGLTKSVEFLKVIFVAAGLQLGAFALKMIFSAIASGQLSGAIRFLAQMTGRSFTDMGIAALRFAAQLGLITLALEGVRQAIDASFDPETSALTKLVDQSSKDLARLRGEVKKTEDEGSGKNFFEQFSDYTIKGFNNDLNSVGLGKPLATFSDKKKNDQQIAESDALGTASNFLGNQTFSNSAQKAAQDQIDRINNKIAELKAVEGTLLSSDREGINNQESQKSLIKDRDVLQQKFADQNTFVSSQIELLTKFREKAIKDGLGASSERVKNIDSLLDSLKGLANNTSSIMNRVADSLAAVNREVRSLNESSSAMVDKLNRDMLNFQTQQGNEDTGGNIPTMDLKLPELPQQGARDKITQALGVFANNPIIKQLLQSVPNAIANNGQGVVNSKPFSAFPSTSEYGMRWGKLHKGLDSGTPIGTPISYNENAKVVDSGTEAGYGNYVEIETQSGLRLFFAHLSEILVKNGDKLIPNQLIAKTGNTGKGTGAHLHTEVRYGDGKPFNPRDKQSELDKIRLGGNVTEIASQPQNKPNINNSKVAALAKTARNLGVPTEELAAIIAQESSFDIAKVGGAGNNYEGLFQLGANERRVELPPILSKVGIEPSTDIKKVPFEKQLEVLTLWAKGRGFKPGMGQSKLYATINGGNPNAFGTDAFGTSANDNKDIKKGGKKYQEGLQFLGQNGVIPKSSEFRQSELSAKNIERLQSEIGILQTRLEKAGRQYLQPNVRANIPPNVFDEKGVPQKASIERAIAEAQTNPQQKDALEILKNYVTVFDELKTKQAELSKAKPDFAREKLGLTNQAQDTDRRVANEKANNASQNNINVITANFDIKIQKELNDAKKAAIQSDKEIQLQKLNAELEVQKKIQERTELQVSKKRYTDAGRPQDIQTQKYDDDIKLKNAEIEQISQQNGLKVEQLSISEKQRQVETEVTVQNERRTLSQQLALTIEKQRADRQLSAFTRGLRDSTAEFNPELKASEQKYLESTNQIIAERKQLTFDIANAEAEIAELIRKNADPRLVGDRQKDLAQKKTGLADLDLKQDDAKKQKVIDDRQALNSGTIKSLNNISTFNSLRSEITNLQADKLERIGGDTFGANRLRILTETLKIQSDLNIKVAEYDNLLKGSAEERSKAGFTNADTAIAEIKALKDTTIELSRVKIDGLKDQFKDLGATIADSADKAGQGFFDDLITGTKSLSDAFSSMAISILKTIGGIASQGLFSSLKNLFGLGGSPNAGFASLLGGGGGIQSLFSSNAAAAPAGLYGPGFSSGGYTGDGGKFDPAGIVHKGEFVVSADRVRNAGAAYLDSLTANPSPTANLAVMDRGDSRQSSTQNNNVAVTNVFNMPTGSNARETSAQSAQKQQQVLDRYRRQGFN